LSFAVHFSSTLPYFQMANATAQVTTNMPTMTKPAVLMLNFSMKFQKLPWMCSSIGSRPNISIVPMNRQIATDRPVIARL
jgi:hypothetical protein